ncbi:PREDICTED: zinc finger protein 831 [Bison bison bison]|uniref:Zinc finger protein 831 n=1 Tax=Bison bison bison TaxID=43346 RepID=A0A6P3HM09_BISBB|nr:PREDICTED: zinc finger protein 831 [Bison bison bison]
MDVPELACPTSPARDQPAPASGPPGAPGGQASPHLTLGPVILSREQGLAPTVFLKALPIPLYHTVPPGGLQPRAPLVTGSLDGGSLPFVLGPLLQPEGLGPTRAGKPVAPGLTVNIVGALPILSPGLGPALGSPGKVRNAGRYLCPHCGRDCLKPSVLEKHIRSHTGERPFPCATCGIAFKTQSNLYKHRRTQTHLNNSRLSSESDGGGSSLLEEGEKAAEPTGADRALSQRPLSPGTHAAGHCPVPTVHVSLVAKNLDRKLDAVPCRGSTFDIKEAPVDSAPGLPLASPQSRWKLPEPRSPTASRPSSALQQQQVEKPGDSKPSEGRLRKCESTDSGYLSRSDSAEQPPAAGSPLHSLSEHSAESEGEGGPGPGRAAAKKRGQRKLKMFSQEKWQVYGKDTFKSIYQRAKASHRGGRKATEVTVGGGAALERPLQQEASGGGDTVVGAKPGPWASPPVLAGLLVTEPHKQRETVAGTGGPDQLGSNRAVSPPTLSSGEALCLDSKSPLLPPHEGPELECQQFPASGPPKGGDLEAPRPDSKLEGGTCGGEGTKETCQQAHVVPRGPGGSSGDPKALEDKLPSERKKLKVEELSCQELLGAGGEIPGGPMQTASPPPQNQDTDPGEKPGGLPGSGNSTESVISGALRWEGPQDTEPPPRPPGCPSQLASHPPAPHTLTDSVDMVFPPQYLLRFPQRDTRPLSPLPQKLDQGQDSICKRRGPEVQTSFAESGQGALLPPCPISGQAPAGEDSCWKYPSWSRSCDQRKGLQREERGGLNAGIPIARALKGSASFLPASMCESWRSGTHDTQEISRSNTVARAGPSGGVLNSWEPTGELGAPSESATQAPSSGCLACCSHQAGSSLSASMAPHWPELALRTNAEPARSCGVQGSFPSLRAEPRLTWCCLSRSLPLPMEQKEKDASVYLGLHLPGGGLQGEGPDAWLVSKTVSGAWTRIRPGDGGQMQMSKLSDPTARGMLSRDRVSEPEWKKRRSRRRAKMPRGSSRWKHLSTHSKRYRGNFLQSRVQLRVTRLRKPHWVLRKDGHPPRAKGPDPCRTQGQASSEMAGVNPSGEPSCVTSESSVCIENREQEEEESGHVSRSFCPNTSLRTIGDTDRPIAKEISSAGEHGAGCPLITAVGSGLSLPSDSLGANDSLPAHSKGLDMGSLETHLLPSQQHISADPTPCVFSDAQEPSSFVSKGTSLGHDLATSAAAFCPSLGARAGHTTLGIHSVEPQDHSQGEEETLAQSSPDRKTIEEGVSPNLLTGKPSSGQRISGSVTPGSTGKIHLEIPALGPASASSHQEEGKHKSCFPSGGQCGCREGLVPCPLVGPDSVKSQGTGFMALKDDAVPSNPGLPTEVPAASLKTLRKRSLEGMRKQTRVESSDTSSDDEDRLVIEI